MIDSSGVDLCLDHGGNRFDKLSLVGFIHLILLPESVLDLLDLKPEEGLLLFAFIRLSL